MNVIKHILKPVIRYLIAKAYNYITTHSVKILVNRSKNLIHFSFLYQQNLTKYINNKFILVIVDG